MHNFLRCLGYLLVWLPFVLILVIFIVGTALEVVRNPSARLPTFIVITLVVSIVSGVFLLYKTDKIDV